MSQRLLLNIRKNFEERSAGGPDCEDETDMLTMSSVTNPMVFGTALTNESGAAMHLSELPQLTMMGDCSKSSSGVVEIPV